MPRELAIQARKERNAALVEVMVLAACADGVVSTLEIDTMLARVHERPEFDGVPTEELRDLVTEAATRLVHQRDMTAVIAQLRERLKTPRLRALAFGLATAVVFADRRAGASELGLLKSFQRGLGVAEDEVKRIVLAVEEGAPLAEALGEEPERLYAEVMVLVGAADGKLTRDEADTLLENLAGDPVFETVRPDRARQYVREALESLKAEGLGPRLAALARGLASQRQRLKAFQLAARMARTDEEGTKAEGRVLELLQASFGLADDEVKRVLKEP